MTTDDAEGALLELASSLVDEVAAARLVLTGHGPAPPRELTPRQLGLAGAANPDLPATPDRPGHEDRRRHCDYCGGTRSELVPGPDGEDGYRVCADERGCLARHEHRYPPRPDLVPDAVLSAVGLADQQLLRRQPTAAQPAPPVTAPGAGLPSGGGAEVPVNEFAAYGGWYDHLGQWHAPALPQFNAWSHTITGGAHTGHLLSGQTGQRRPHYYAGPAYLPMAVYGAEPAQETSPGGQGSQQASEEELEARHLYEAARGGSPPTADVAFQQPAEPAGGTQRPARQRPRDRYGRRRALRYTGQRRSRPSSWAPGSGGADSGGATGGSAET